MTYQHDDNTIQYILYTIYLYNILNSDNHLWASHLFTVTKTGNWSQIGQVIINHFSLQSSVTKLIRGRPFKIAMGHGQDMVGKEKALTLNLNEYPNI